MNIKVMHKEESDVSDQICSYLDMRRKKNVHNVHEDTKKVIIHNALWKKKDKMELKKYEVLSLPQSILGGRRTR